MSPPGRLKRQELGDHERRARILAHVKATPGQHMRKLAKELDMPVTSLEYHLYRLEREGQLVTRKEGRTKTYFAPGSVDRRDLTAMGLLRQRTPRTLLMHILERPGLAQGELAHHLGVTQTATASQLRRLIELDLVEARREGRTKRLHVRDEKRVAELLVEHQASFKDPAVARFVDLWSDVRTPRQR